MRLIVALLLAASLAACGSEESDDPPVRESPPAAEEPAPESTEEPSRVPAEPEPNPEPAEVQDSAYTDSKDLCGLFPVSKVAAEYGGDPANPVSVADAYAKKSYRGRFQASAREGCLAGLKAR